MHNSHTVYLADLLKHYAAEPDSNNAQVIPKMALILKHFSSAVQCMEASGSPGEAIQALFKSLQEEVPVNAFYCNLGICTCDSVHYQSMPSHSVSTRYLFYRWHRWHPHGQRCNGVKKHCESWLAELLAAWLSPCTISPGSTATLNAGDRSEAFLVACHKSFMCATSGLLKLQRLIPLAACSLIPLHRPMTIRGVAQICTRMAGQHDFCEGVRAAVVDKDKRPQWIPSHIQDVTDEDVSSLSQPVPGMSLQL